MMLYSDPPSTKLFTKRERRERTKERNKRGEEEKGVGYVLKNEAKGILRLYVIEYFDNIGMRQPLQQLAFFLYFLKQKKYVGSRRVGRYYYHCFLCVIAFRKLRDLDYFDGY